MKKIEKVLHQYLLDNQAYLYRVAYSYVRNEQDALDILQEAITKALGSYSSLKNAEAIRTWFYRILAHTAIDFTRKKKRLDFVEDTVLEALSAPTTDTYEDITLHGALDSLDEISRTIVVLRFFEDFKIEDIAKILKLNINTVTTVKEDAVRVKDAAQAAGLTEILPANVFENYDLKSVTNHHVSFGVVTLKVGASGADMANPDTGKMYFITEDDMAPFTSLRPDQSFYINQEGQLVIAFDEYDVAPGSMGRPEFIIPMASIQDGLADGVIFE